MNSIIIKSIKKQMDSNFGIPSFSTQSYTKSEAVTGLSLESEIESICLILENSQTTLWDVKRDPLVLNCEKLRKEVESLPNFKSLAKRTLQLFQLCAPSCIGLRSFSEVSTELKKNENNFSVEKFQNFNSTSQNLISNLSKFRLDHSETEIEDLSKNKNMSSFSEMDGAFKKREGPLLKYKINKQKNYHQFQQSGMKVKLPLNFEEADSRKQDQLFHFLHSTSDAPSTLHSNIEQADLQVFSPESSEIEYLKIKSELDEDPLSKIRQYKIENDDREQDWDQANSTISKIKDILVTFPQDSEQKKQSRINPEFFENLKTKMKSQFSGKIEEKSYKQLEKEFSIREVSSEDKERSSQNSKNLREEEEPTQKLNPQLEQAVLDFHQFRPYFQVCSKVIDLTIQQDASHQNSIHEQNHPVESDRIENNQFKFSQSMVDQMSLNVGGGPVYLINDASSEGNRTDREMYSHERLQFSEHVRTPKQINDPYIEVQEFYDMREKVLHVEQQKMQLMQQLRNADKQIKMLKKEYCGSREVIDKLEIRSEQKLQEFMKIIDCNQETIVELNEELKRRQEYILQLEQINLDLGQERNYISEQLKEKEQIVHKLKQEISQIKEKVEIEMEKAHTENNEKTKTIYELQKQLYESKQQLKSQIFELTRVNDELRGQMQEINKDVDTKRVQIQKLQASNTELMSSIQKACNGDELQQIEPLAEIQRVYSHQFSKLKEDYDIQILTKKNSISDLNREKDQLEKQVKICKEKQRKYLRTIQESKSMIQQQKQTIEKLQEEIKKEQIVMSSQVEEEISYLRKQIVIISKELEAKNLNIKELNTQLRKSKVTQSSPVSIDFVGEEENNAYVRDLKQVIFDYQQIISSHHKVIKELQESSYEFLQDALVKEEEISKLEEEVASLKEELRKVVSDRLVILKENAKMKKMISNSEKKISAIGSKLTSYAFRQNDESSYTIERLKILNHENQPGRDTTIKI